MLTISKNPILAIATTVISTLLLSSFIIRRSQRGPRRTYNVNLSGQVVIITGCSAGIGKETAREMAKRNAVVIFACRDEAKTLRIIAQIKKETNNENLFFMKLELSDFDSVREFSVKFHQKYNKLNMLINNAGIGFPNVHFDDEGHDLNFKTNHMGHFLLTNLLMDLIISTRQSRVINVSSDMHANVKTKVDFDKAYYGRVTKLAMSYSTSKQANILFTNQLQKLFNEKNIEAKSVSLHPGVVNTEIWSKSVSNKFLKFILIPFNLIFQSFTINEAEGAWTSIYAALQPYEELKPNGYYKNNSLSRHSGYIIKFDQAQELWDYSVDQLKIKPII